ncbi:MAG: hypothetical protein COV74_05020 [Candidatus Omnitrophica bacterium CG11_big_fil_rev_8_21_14_0_20_45_26]|uniref:Peptidase M48 domain-containing protein n=1 Tax=Candidatus Abzuiibacterium crystallinum TaxID=1974748 RepID=A0A2H0LRX8_9BACT|nr:MAG: hypothetical protein COV74_05020 [Candidatus Omnitrophica bacterium CG11_big_fil_rev_8_21_14_0_20_45_26]PIW63623.1 MAG: hypothetical protein COW12_09935 [Candidatus Omnitrophica bacterium CG12_big_fil_rev_8_21_14_0_65_45_16]
MGKHIPLIFSLLILVGCSSKQVDYYRPMSDELPLSYADLAEIREGSEQHEEIVKNNKFYRQPEMQQYLMSIGYRLAAVSERPHLPYKFFIVDDSRVDAFSAGGGYIYVTKGMLEFVDSEAELAAVLAHEIAHVAAGVHTPKVEHKMTKKRMFFQAMKIGAGAAAAAAGGMVGGPAGTVAENAVSGIEGSLPGIRKHFQVNDELTADRNAVFYLAKTNYDPRELLKFVEKLSQIDVQNITKYIYFLNSHPPYEERRNQLHELLADINFEKRSMNVYEDRYMSIRMMTMYMDSISAPPNKSIAAHPAIETPPLPQTA